MQTVILFSPCLNNPLKVACEMDGFKYGGLIQYARSVPSKDNIPSRSLSNGHRWLLAGAYVTLSCIYKMFSQPTCPETLPQTQKSIHAGKHALHQDGERNRSSN